MNGCKNCAILAEELAGLSEATRSQSSNRRRAERELPVS